MMPSLKLIAVDIDGTLLNSAFRISDVNLRALSEAHQAGIHVVLATGRRHSFALPIAQLLGFKPFIISCNGAIIRDVTGRLLSKTLMPCATARVLLDHMQNYNDYAVLTFDRDGNGSLVVQSNAKLTRLVARWIEQNVESILEVNPIQDSLTEDLIQVMFCGPILEMTAAIEHLNSGIVSEEIHCPVTQYDNRNLCIIDVVPRGCNKGSALEALCSNLHIGREDVLAVGDNYNDREMLAFAGHAFVVANAHADMKSRGWRVTRSNDEDGVAHAIASVLESAATRI